jgi:pimeloyl-ACP methyl ester carboxylesterase
MPLIRYIFAVAIFAASLVARPITYGAQAANAPAEGGEVVNLPLASGAHQRLLYLAPSNPRGTLIMLPGGAGDVGIERDGDMRHDKNFLVRTRALWLARNYAVVIPDARENLRGLRSSPDYAAIVAALVDFAHKRQSGPVFLIGTSQGSIAAVNGAAHAQKGQIAGLVLTESVSRQGGSHETVFDAGAENVRIPVLIVANDDDRCDVAPPQDASRIAAALTYAPEVKILHIKGGEMRSHKDCGSLTPHGYFGIEADVVGKIADWLDAHS